jgi:uncharacterized protein YbjT (DUF2867 family)
VLRLAGPLRATHGRIERVQRDLRLVEQHAASLGECNTSRRALEQPDAELGLELRDRAREGRRGDPEAFSGASEAQLVRDGDEVPQRARLDLIHACRLIAPSEPVLPDLGVMTHRGLMIVITTPTGQIGHQVLENLVGSDEPLRVIARDPSRLSPRTRERAEVVQGSHGDREVVDKALAGADAVFWLVPPDLRAESLEAVYVDFSRPACEAFESQGIKRVVGVSALGRGTPWAASAGLVSASLAMDDLIASTGVSYRALTMPSFMDNVIRQVDAIKNQGMFFSPIAADRKLPTCATRDIAAVAAELLLDDSWSGQGSVPVLGPEDLSFDDMARIMSEALGTPVRFQQIPGEAYRASLVDRGMSDAMAQATLDMMVAKDNGIDNAEPRTPQSTTPTSFRQWCEDVLEPAVNAGSSA